MSLPAIILFAHGSRDPLWRKPIEAVADTVRSGANGALVSCAYLELTEPDLSTAIAALVEKGASSVRVVPMFLGVGRHAREDLPVLMADLKARYPDIYFELQTAIGEDPRVIQLLAEIVLSA